MVYYRRLLTWWYLKRIAKNSGASNWVIGESRTEEPVDNRIAQWVNPKNIRHLSRKPMCDQRWSSSVRDCCQMMQDQIESSNNKLCSLSQRLSVVLSVALLVVLSRITWLNYINALHQLDSTFHSVGWTLKFSPQSPNVPKLPTWVHRCESLCRVLILSPTDRQVCESCTTRQLATDEETACDCRLTGIHFVQFQFSSVLCPSLFTHRALLSTTESVVPMKTLCARHFTELSF